MKEENLNIRITTEEKDKLKKYCEENQRTQTEVIREMIRKLKLRKKDV